MKILVGDTGFVGSNIIKNSNFDRGFNSSNIKEAFGLNPELLIYAGVPAVKYIANTQPAKDFEFIKEALDNIKKINPKKLVLISSVDVYKDSYQKNENSFMNTTEQEAYGYNRYMLELMVRENFEDALIVRLPALFGINIKKNFVYDMINIIPSMIKSDKFEELLKKNKKLKKYYDLNQNFYKLKNISKVDKELLKKIFLEINFTALNFTDSRAEYQFYNLDYLYDHIELALKNNIKLLNIATEPISASEIYTYIFGEEFKNEILQNPPKYNFKTLNYEMFGGKNGYIFSKEQILTELKAFVQPLKISISNIGFDSSDIELLEDYDAIEIAPTKIVSDPYNNIEDIVNFSKKIKLENGLEISSMQSIWYQVTNSLYDPNSYDYLVNITKKAIDLSEKINCKNIVFGSPKNRNMANVDSDYKTAIKFFKEIGKYAKDKNVIIAIEPNPKIYNTNFINTTQEAFDFVKKIKLPGVKVNIDLGTIIYNKEDIKIIEKNIDLVNHIHISEPNLVKIEKRSIHKDLKKILNKVNYKGYISIEMKEQTKEDLKWVLKYVKEVFKS